MDNGIKPAWRVFYKLPFKKKNGNLQWRILHAAIAVNVFVSVINPTVSCACLFCGEVETVSLLF